MGVEGCIVITVRKVSVDIGHFEPSMVAIPTVEWKEKEAATISYIITDESAEQYITLAHSPVM